MKLQRASTDSPFRRVPIAGMTIGEEEIGAAVEVLRSGKLRAGSECAAFEEEFARSVGAAFALTASSGTAALHMAYAALLTPGDEVLVPSFTFFATASMVRAVGAVPVFCDIDPETLCIDADDAARRISARTRAIAPVHLFGNPADVPRLHQLAETHHLGLIWDAAQALGTLWQGKDVGGLDDVVCYSFYPTKNITTGEGGMVCTNRADVAGRVKLLRDHGQSDKYHHVALGYNFRLTDLQAAIGRVQLRRLPEWIEQRRANAHYLRSRLAASALVRVQKEQPGGAHAYHQFSVLLDERVDRDALVERLGADGVECAVHYPIPLHRQPAFAAETRGLSLPVSEATSRRILSLPVHPQLSLDDLRYVADQMLSHVALLARP